MTNRPEPTREDLLRWDREHVWHAFTQMAAYEPFVIASAHDRTLVDIDGREYLDGVSSLWCNVHGHQHPKLDAALRGQLGKVAHVTSLGSSNPTTIELARRLVELSPGPLEHVFFSSDGSSAVEVALKMAFQYWRQREEPCPEKSVYVSLDDAYHGDTLGSVSVGGVERFHTMFSPLLFETLRVPTPTMYRLPGGVTTENACAYYLDQLEGVLRENAPRIAALVIEPMLQAAAGMIVHPPGYLRGVRELTKTYDILLIADEVAVGFGRTGTLFACEQERVEPDFLCLGKGITGGYLPMSATLTTTEVWNAFLGTPAESKQFFHGHTYGGNPLSAAVALASLDVFEQEETLREMIPKIARLREHLQRWAQLPHVGNVRQCGFIAGIELVADRETHEPYPWAERRGQQVCDVALKHGVWIRPLGNVVVIMPPLNTTMGEIDRIAEAVEAGIAEATAFE